MGEVMMFLVFWISFWFCLLTILMISVSHRITVSVTHMDMILLIYLCIETVIFTILNSVLFRSFFIW